MLLWPRRPMVSWSALKTAWPAGQGREATFRLLRPILGSSSSKRQGSPKRRPAKGHKNDKGPGAYPV